MNLDPALLETAEALKASNWPEVEVTLKKGRSRSLRWTPHGEVGGFRQEEGWAARAGDARRSFFYAAVGAPDPGAAWPEGDGRGLRLPSARPVPDWSPPSDLEVPLVGENEALGLFESLARELDSELPGARLLAGELEDGSSESQIVSTRDVASVTRQRTATLRLEAAIPGRTRASVSLLLAERAARSFTAPSLARRLADRLTVTEKGEAPVRDRGEFLLAPPVVVALVSALAGLWVGPAAEDRAAGLADRSGRIGGGDLTLIDDGRFPGGVLEAPVDGEGLPTRKVVLVEGGLFRQPLLAWWQAGSKPQRISGCARRPSWRDLPQPGPTHLYVEPGAASAASLIGGLSRGYYLLDVEGGPRIEADYQRFAVPVCGYGIAAGRSTGPVHGAWLTGTVTGLLTGILAVARDLMFLPVASGMVGSPTVLVKGLELRRKL